MHVPAGRPIMLGTYRIAGVRARILWHPGTGELRSAMPGHDWPRAAPLGTPACDTRHAAECAARDLFAGPEWGLRLAG